MPVIPVDQSSNRPETETLEARFRRLEAAWQAVKRGAEREPWHREVQQ